ncbi:MaoC family dehydratase [Senegalia massiliensis]|uniref:Enoyl-CoA hydratase n=1 Tax=Senegalia massiliensis TaxID=1720316 RepID=A0A845QVY5_9CLOT|nr:MaoC family dehydratase [Senegalia massiliensis]NBI06164.1 enoyl-CoA hydratase [Senegalia massiliensis]
MIKQISYDDIRVGDSAIMNKRISVKDVESFAEILNDKDSFHVDEEVARKSIFGKRVCHGMHIASYISEVTGKELPGFGTIYLNQTLNFKTPVYLNSNITIEVKVLEKLPRRKLRMLTVIKDEDENLVLDGEAIVKVSK